MKLTLEQVATEKEKFYDWWNEQNYEVDPIWNDFKIWLACRESSNEVTLPKMVMLQKPPNGRHIGAFYESEINSALESQGFTVKSQE